MNSALLVVIRMEPRLFLITQFAEQTFAQPVGILVALRPYPTTKSGATNSAPHVATREVVPLSLTS